jgi:hypothetical protein
MFSPNWVSAPDYVLKGIVQITFRSLAFFISCSAEPTVT